MRSIFGWDYPPGCHSVPGDEPDTFELQMAHRCRKCGAFLSAKSDGQEGWEEGWNCDGKGTEYQQGYDEAEIQILGEEFRGKTYTVRETYCGKQGDHQPHRVIMDAGTAMVYKCRKCGHENKIGH